MISQHYKPDKLKIKATEDELRAIFNLVQAAAEHFVVNMSKPSTALYEKLALLGGLEDLGGLFQNLMNKNNKGLTTISLTKCNYYSLMNAFNLYLEVPEYEFVDRNNICGKLHQEGINLKWEEYPHTKFNLLYNSK